MNLLSVWTATRLHVNNTACELFCRRQETAKQQPVIYTAWQIYDEKGNRNSFEEVELDTLFKIKWIRKLQDKIICQFHGYIKPPLVSLVYTLNVIVVVCWELHFEFNFSEVLS